MRFDLSRTTATIGIFHPREEKNKGMAFDIPFEVTVGADLLEMLLPADPETDIKSFISELFSEEGYVRRPAISPISIHRKPEGATISIWDNFGLQRNAKPLMLKGCTLNKLKATLQSPHQLVLTGQIQYSQYNDEELIRINALSNSNTDIRIEIEQNDMFDYNEQPAPESDPEEPPAEAVTKKKTAKKKVAKKKAAKKKVAKKKANRKTTDEPSDPT